MQPRLEHLIGYPVERISKHDKQPCVVLEGGYKLVIEDKRIKLDSGLAGQRFVSYEEVGDNGLRLLFNQDELVVAKNKLLIFHPEHDAVFDPWESHIPEIAPDPSADRIKEGPTRAEDKKEARKAK